MISFHRASLIAQLVKNPPSMQKTLVQFLGQEERICYPLQYSWAFLVAQLVKNPPTMQEAWVWSLGWEDPLEKAKTTHSSILAHGQSMGLQRVRHNWDTFTHDQNWCIKELEFLPSHMIQGQQFLCTNNECSCQLSWVSGKEYQWSHFLIQLFEKRKKLSNSVIRYAVFKCQNTVKYKN